MNLHDAALGTHYELTIAPEGEGWCARWCVRDGAGRVPDGGALGSLVRGEAEEAFRAARRLIEDQDAGVAGNDWDFVPPLPPWLDG